MKVLEFTMREYKGMLRFADEDEEESEGPTTTSGIMASGTITSATITTTTTTGATTGTTTDTPTGIMPPTP